MCYNLKLLEYFFKELKKYMPVADALDFFMDAKIIPQARKQFLGRPEFQFDSH